MNTPIKSPIIQEDYKINEYFDQLTTETEGKFVGLIDDTPGRKETPGIHFFETDEEVEKAIKLFFFKKPRATIAFDFSLNEQTTYEDGSFKVSEKTYYFGKNKIATEVYSNGKKIASYLMIGERLFQVPEEKMEAFINKYERVSMALKIKYRDLLNQIDTKYAIKFRQEKEDIIKEQAQNEIIQLENYFERIFPTEKLEDITFFLEFTLEKVFEREGYPVAELSIEGIFETTKESALSKIDEDTESGKQRKNGIVRNRKYYYQTGSNSSHDFFFGIDEYGNFYQASFETKWDERKLDINRIYQTYLGNK